MKKIGIGHYFLGYGQPMLMMLPINVITDALSVIMKDKAKKMKEI